MVLLSAHCQGPDCELGEFSQCGLIPRIIHGMFDAVDKADPNLEFSIKISYVEIYMETIRDLLEPSSINLQLREDKVRSRFVLCLLVYLPCLFACTSPQHSRVNQFTALLGQ